jgi:methionyl-tRNA synthetase
MIIDLDQELKELDNLLSGKASSEQKKEEKKEDKKAEQKQEEPDIITIDDFAKIDFRTVTVLEAERVEGAEKLLKLKVRMGDEIRQVVSGIAKYYEPEELIGKNMILVANLKPVKIRGIESQGMILAASDDKDLSVVTLDKPMPSGSKVR